MNLRITGLSLLPLLRKDSANSGVAIFRIINERLNTDRIYILIRFIVIISFYEELKNYYSASLSTPYLESLSSHCATRCKRTEQALGA